MKTHYKRHIRWSEKEIKILQEEYPIRTMEELCSLLPNRTGFAIGRKAAILGLVKETITKRTKWSADEDKILRENHQNFTIEELKVLFINRSLYAIKGRLQYLNLSVTYKKFENTPPEILRQRAIERSKGKDLLDPRVRFLGRAKNRAKKFKLPFNITLEDIIIPEICPLLNIKIFRGVRKLCSNSPSLDRKIPNLGYVKGNIWVISHKANAIKNDATLQELKLITHNLEKELLKFKR